KCIAKIEKNQLKDGSWNISGGWAPILGTSLASQSLYIAQRKGAASPQLALASVAEYTKVTSAPMQADSGRLMDAGKGAGTGGGLAGGIPGGVAGGVMGGVTTGSVAFVSAETAGVSAGVSLYKRAQELEQLSRTDKDREKNA